MFDKKLRQGVKEPKKHGFFFTNKLSKSKYFTGGVYYQLNGVF
jgi:hypothetical protein